MTSRQSPGQHTRLAVKVVPSSSRNRIAGWIGDALKVTVTAPPERGQANAAVAELLAGILGVQRSSVRIAAGAARARKIVEIDGLSETAVRARLTAPTL